VHSGNGFRLEVKVMRFHLFETAQMYRVRSEGSPASSLHSKVADSEEGLDNRDITGVRVQHLHSDSAQHPDPGSDGESVWQCCIIIEVRI